MCMKTLGIVMMALAAGYGVCAMVNNIPALGEMQWYMAMLVSFGGLVIYWLS